MRQPIAQHSVQHWRSITDQVVAVWRGLLANGKKAGDLIVLNAGAALYVSGVADSIADGLARARAVIADGRARERLQQFVATTRQLAGLL